MNLKDTLMLWLGLKLRGSGCNWSHFPGGNGIRSTSCLLYGFFFCFAIEMSPSLCIYMILQNCLHHSCPEDHIKHGYMCCQVTDKVLYKYLK